MKNMLKMTVAAGVLAVGAQQAMAVPTISISTDGGSSWASVQDNLAGDAVGAPGVISWSTSSGIWDVIVSTGYTKPDSGSAVNPYLDLAFSARSTGAGSLLIAFSENEFLDAPAGATAKFGGTMATPGGTGVFSAYYNTANVAFDGTGGLAALGTQILSFGPLGPGNVSASGTAGSAPTSPYALTLLIEITHAGTGSGTQLSSGDFELTVPDGGATAMLLGMGVLGLGAVARRRN